jgi:hypothetical protein
MSILLMLASLPANLDQCAAAVRSAPSTALTACQPPKEIDLFDPNAPDPRCVGALAAGQLVGKNATAVPMMRKALTDEFEKKLSLCKNPPAQKQVPEIKTTNLWD